MFVFTRRHARGTLRFCRIFLLQTFSSGTFSNNLQLGNELNKAILYQILPKNENSRNCSDASHRVVRIEKMLNEFNFSLSRYSSSFLPHLGCCFQQQQQRTVYIMRVRFFNIVFILRNLGTENKTLAE